MKYKLVDKITRKEYICSKVIINKFNYYTNDDMIELGDYMYHPEKGFEVGKLWCYFPDVIIAAEHWFPIVPQNKATFHGFKKIIASNDPKVNLPKVTITKLKDIKTYTFERVYKENVIQVVIKATDIKEAMTSLFVAAKNPFDYKLVKPSGNNIK